MPAQPEIDKFQQSWNQTAGWAQTKGAKYNDYYPIYQQDSQRFLAGHNVMSQAERERAILAAANPQKATQATPSTSSSPWNIIGNAITDARNIFTGIGDIAIHPLHNGLVDSLYNTFDLMTGAHHLTGDASQKVSELLTGTVLSWIPGAADLGTLVQADKSVNPLELLFNPKGLEAEAQRPFSTILDILPLANKAAAMKVAGDAGFAERVGMTATKGEEGFVKPSVYRVGKGYLFNTQLKKVPENIGPDGNYMTIGDKIHKLTGGSVVNTAPAIHDLGQGIEMTDNRQTFRNQFIWTPVLEADDHLNPEQMAKVQEIMDPAQASNLDERLKQAEVDDPAVADAIRARKEGPMSFHTEEILSLPGVRAVRHPVSGQLQVLTQTGHAAAIKAADTLQATSDAVARTIPQLEGLVAESDKAHAVLGLLSRQLGDATQKARVVHDATQEGGTFPVKVHGTKRATGFATKHVEEEWFGTGGNMDRLKAKVDEGHIQDANLVAKAWLKRMDHWDPVSLNADSNPQFRAAKIQVQQIAQVTDKILELRKEQDKRVYGAGKIWEGLTPYRDRMHENDVATLKAKHTEELRTAKDQKTLGLNRLSTSYQLFRRSIQTKYADLKRNADAQIKEVTQKYEIEKAKATTKNLLAREAFNQWRRGRIAQGMPNPRDPYEAAQVGVRIAQGAPGSVEALQAAHNALELQKQAELAQVPSKALLTAQMKNEMKDSRAAEKDMTDRVTKAYDKRDSDLAAKQEAERLDLKKVNLGKRAREGEVSTQFNDWMDAQKAFAQAVWDHPSDNNIDLYFSLLSKHIVKNEAAVRALSHNLAEKHGWEEEHLQNLRANPVIMGQFIQSALMATEKDPIFEGIDPHFLDDMVKEAKNELADLNKKGIFPQYLPHVSSTQLAADGRGSMAIHTLTGKGVPKPDALSPRTWGMDTSKLDVMAGLQRGTKQILVQKGMDSAVRNYIDPHISIQKNLEDVLTTAYKSEMSRLQGESRASFIAQKISDWNLEKIDPNKEFGFRLPKWGEGDVYINKDLMKAFRKMGDARKRDHGVFDKGTKLFRYSILGLSPRYDAHITMGGTFLLALRSTPYMPTFLGKAVRGLKTGEFDQDMHPTMTQMGTTEYELSSANKALEHFGAASGREQVRIAAGEHIEVKQGIKLAAATPLHWLKALADLNLHMMNYVTKVQRSVATLDWAAKAERDASRHPITDEYGNVIKMTRERAMMEGMKHAEAVFGDLRRMSPFERQLARSFIPFYGWEKHILQYVLSYPADHPWRAMMLANMAEFDSQNTPGGLPSRYQFLFFLGKPDDQGNVTALDLRAMNPLRDVANYASAGGIISSLNPMITAGVSYVDPSIIYGGNTLYPNLTYDQFYGIETAGPQGNLLTAAGGVVPQLGAIQSAMQLMGQRQGMSNAALVKSIGNQLNFPWVPQSLNLKQEAGKTAIAQYQVTKQLALNAWQTGDFSQIADLGSVPDPRNADYETPVNDLQVLYNSLAKAYPGVPPDQVAQPLPSLHL
jgi:hypothetical protein